jgi:hypothetical protein
MAKQTQSESRLSLNRRQLLAATADRSNHGDSIAPNANTVAVTNSAQAASVTKASVSESPALNVCASTARKIQEIASAIGFVSKLGCPYCLFQANCEK